LQPCTKLGTCKCGAAQECLHFCRLSQMIRSHAMLHLYAPAGDGMDPALVALLAAAGKSASSLPADMAAALTKGKVRQSGRRHEPGHSRRARGS
jgi:hypothetical protein